MMRQCYAWIWALGLPLFKVCAFFSPKWRDFYAGRRALRRTLTKWKAHKSPPNNKKPVLWIHAASLGEFEQVRPLIERLRAPQSPLKNCFIWLSFFSPSGYRLRYDYALVDQVSYAPFDTPQHVRDFLSGVAPRWGLIVKSEWWPELLSQAMEQHIRLFSIGTRWHHRSAFMPTFVRKTLRGIQHFFAQDQKTIHVLRQYGVSACTKIGDMRYDRVCALASSREPVEVMTSFGYDKRPVIVWGSIWMSDWRRIKEALSALISEDWKHVMVPHEPTDAFMRRIEKDLKEPSVRYSKAEKQVLEKARFLVMDRVGLLGRLYASASVAYVGGGFRGALHNLLEPAAYGCPVVFGHGYDGAKFPEADTLQKAGGARAVTNAKGLIDVIGVWRNADARQRAAQAAKTCVEKHKGATERLMTALMPLLQS